MPATAAAARLFTISESAGRIRLRFNAVIDLDSSNCDSIGAAMLAVVERHPGSDLTVDLANVHFLASMALSQLLKLDQHIRSHGGHLVLANPQPDVRKVFAITRLDHVLSIEDAPAQ